ncbi:DNA-formamidopyrimidine glycosylase family protein [Parachryseolinea silvisoli]|uniref:DNA-formamidopyrimidine glycosylase family protein n=1 Tax=Parachryseolinea silvisoli TaxID=2873601 RepID=UPI002265B3B7|nr:DNA-formamidopyrimidine glycosylase family protein [Parachryseolinea silvisoli]MCD9017846.1 endonuclease [Parachryseolinea silvisoli]
MPEGPSIIILKEAVSVYARKKILHASGNTQQFDPAMLEGKSIRSFKSWGKHFLICFPTFTLRIHFLLFGSYLINERKDKTPRLSLQFKNGEINFYACGLRLLEEPLDDLYDWAADVMSDQWDPAQALQKLKDNPDMLVCDALLDQSIFSGSGNIIKNEVLFRTHIHPQSLVGKLPAAKRRQLIDEVVRYSFDFLAWKREFTLRKHWQAHTKKTCPRDGAPLQKEYLGKTNRRTFYCDVCQKLYV